MRYKTIVIDPPWKYSTWGKSSHSGDVDRPMPYPTLSLKQIESLPVKSLADNNCELYLWTTQKYLKQAIKIMEAWGFKYCTTITWCKKPMGTGQGGVFTPTTEFLLHGRIGKMPKVKRINSTWFLTKRERVHSRKPEVFQDIIETVTEGPRLEMFARRKRANWHVWGNEVENDISVNF